MQTIADLHIHSKYSRACSKGLDIANLEKYAKIKGIDLLGTSDFTHPEWIKELKSKLNEEKSGKSENACILRTKNGFPFILSTEVSLIYTDMGKGRKVHNIILAPSFEIVDQITEALKKKGRVDYDGRPIFKITCPELVEMMRSVSKDIEIIPAHAWTPYFGVFGSMSGFDSLNDAFKDKAKDIHAIETGLSSNPPMNWRLSKLDSINLVSFSDSHSFWPWRLGREATVFDIPPEKLTYKMITEAIRTGKNLWGTIEVDPAYGKYHFDGHRNCKVCLHPNETKNYKGICPKCGRQLTIGVVNRVEELADRPEGYKPKNAKGFASIIPLSEIISIASGKAVATKAVWAEYYKILKAGKSENDILLNTPKKDILKVTEERIAELIIKNREGKIKIMPGYDGEYGVPVLGDGASENFLKHQKHQNQKYQHQKHQNQEHQKHQNQEHQKHQNQKYQHQKHQNQEHQKLSEARHIQKGLNEF